DETVKDVTVLGGSVDVLGKVTGDLTVLAGSGELHSGAQVAGDVSVLGGKLKIDDGVLIEGDVNVFGGELDKAPGAQVHGDIDTGGHHENAEAPPQDHKARLLRAARSFAGSLTKTAMLFVFGAVLVALATLRMTSLRNEV